jgi:hypothetical protein
MIIGISAFALFAISLERYLTIVKRYTLTDTDYYKLVGSIWTFSTLYNFIPFVTNSSGLSIALMPGRLHCNVAFWYERLVNCRDRSPLSVLMNVVVIFSILGATNGMAFCYYEIFNTYKKSNSSRKKSKGVESKKVKFGLIKVVCCCNSKRKKVIDQGIGTMWLFLPFLHTIPRSHYYATNPW